MKAKIKHFLLLLGCIGSAQIASSRSVEAKQLLSTDDHQHREASALSTIYDPADRGIYDSQSLGAPIELGIIGSQESHSNILENELYEDKDELGSQIELGNGQLQQEPSVYLSGSIGFTSNKNILSAPIKPIEEGVFNTSVGVVAIPKIGKNLRLLLGINQGSVRYSRFRALNLDYKGMLAGLIWETNPRTTLSLTGFGTALSSSPANKVFFSDIGLIANIRHDIPVNENMLFNIAAQSEFHETTGNNPPSNTLSHFSYGLSTSLKALLSPKLNAELEYRVRFDDYSHQRRNDINNQVNFKLGYAISPYLQIGYLANYNFNTSSNRFSNYGAFSTGLELSTLMPLF
jgi:Putative beta-barrel porin 2